MSIANKRISVTELDFDQIKENLKNFLRGQDEFKDYDFEGAGLSILLDVLAYNTHYNNLYTNLAVNETFLDSASKRTNVVSLAKMLGYTPRSATCATAVVDLKIINPTSSPHVVTLPAYQPFETLIDGISYTFYNTGSYTVESGANGYIFSNIEIVEGTPLSFNYTVSTGIRFIIPNPDVDVSTIKITVQESSSSGIFDTYTFVNNIVDLTSTSKVYFIKELDGGLYEIVFGDGVLGKQLSNGNVVIINYFVSGKSGANGARLFNYNGTSLIGGSTNISTKVIATNGGASEDIDSIKYNAPRSFAAQNRAVTIDDYKILILTNFAEAAAVSCWGGEDNYPAIYGKVFLCVRPKDADKLTTAQKTYILGTLLNHKSVVSITPEIIDPEYIDIYLNITAYYNPNETTKSPSELGSIITGTVIDYDASDLLKFDSVFRYSKLTRLIDTSESSITNCIMTVLLKRALAVKYNISAQYVLNIINPLFSSGSPDGSIYSTGFYVKGSTAIHYLDDDGDGLMRLYVLDSNFQKNIVNYSIGTVDYALGKIVISNLTITDLADFDFIITMKPASNDVVSALHQIIKIDNAGLSVNLIADRTSAGDTGAGFNYIFTPSRI